MTLSIWRYAHLALALLSSLVLIIASVTGVVLAVDAAGEKTLPYQTDNFNTLTLEQCLPELSKVYTEIISISVDHNQFVTIEAFDENGNDIKAYINPGTGEQLGIPISKSNFIQWNIALHRSLFLKETGRFIVGLASFLFFLIAITGTILLIKRQNGIRHFFSKINKDSLPQYLHVVSGRLFLIPVIIIALTGTYLFLIRFDLLPKKEGQPINYKENSSLVEIPRSDFPVFKETKLSEVSKLDFPYMEDPEEYFVLKLKKKELTIHQFTGQIIKETTYPVAQLIETLSLDLHTGRTNIIWAIVLGLGSLNVLLFIYSGFTITLKRTKTKVKNKFKAEKSEFILLVGSENGTTYSFANQIHIQLQGNGKKSFLIDLNHYTTFPKAKHVLVFTSTYGLGTAPTNALNFEELLHKHPQNQKVNYSVIGFGSKSYPDFCAYAERVDRLLAQQEWAEQALELHTVNEKSAKEFTKWVTDWANMNMLALATTPSLYNQKLPKLKTFKMVDRAEITADDITTFRINLKPSALQKFKSGDLLAIYFENNSVERFYSIGKVNGTVQLIVRLHTNGIGSGFLYRLRQGENLRAHIIKNAHFHFPKKAPKIALIANGTGIAPFLGMLEENKYKIETHLYCGFRKENSLTKRYAEMANQHIQGGNLQSFHLALSRQEPYQYVMALIEQDEQFFFELLENKGVIMICGSLNMQRDVEETLHSICAKNGKPYDTYKTNGQILTDCY